jgi:short-subunit dehydrogenase
MTTVSTPNVAWVAGVGASAGLGAALARRFARGGLTVAITGRNESRLRTIAKEIGDAGGQAQVLPGDVSHPAEVERLAATLRQTGTLRSALFNAGNMVRGPALDITPEQS